MPLDQDKMREVVLREVSAKIGIPLEYVRDGEMNDYVCKDAKGFTYLISGYHWAEKGYIVRSVARGWRRFGSRIRTLIGGQVIQGKQVGWWTESGEDSFIIPNGEFWNPAFYEKGGEHLRTPEQQTVPVQ